MAQTSTADVSFSSKEKSWNYRHLGCAFLIGFILQQLFLPCLCNLGEAEIKFALLIDVLVAIRIFIAYSRKERGRGWIFYSVLLYTSAGWITLVARIVFGPDGW